ncbi:MAG: DUF1549 domain-containing protein [Planctomycetaceae bacterium]|nr:DUF1549 domain-containing protein [Planctomycetaceae bacterium]
MSRLRHLSKLLPLLVVLGVVALVSWAARSPLPAAGTISEVGTEPEDLAQPVQRINAAFERRWRDAAIEPAQPAPDLQVLRRLTLALLGTIPSLEEIRQFEADTRPDRLEHWTRRLLADKRFAVYFAERLARSYVGKEEGQFVIFRRDRFSNWLGEQIQQNTPYDKIVGTMVSSTGLWTGNPATNFVTAAVNDDGIDENKLTGKTVRAFLGQRIDCAQCHNHPFADWKQDQFEGLAAFYGQVQTSLVGIEDKTTRDGKPVDYSVEDRQTKEQRIVPEGVPFHPEWLPGEGTRRERLALWLTHPQNRRFERAIANRVWALLFGRALHEPVDDIPDPDDPNDPWGEVLNSLGADFREHGCDLRRLIQVIAALKPFRVGSEWGGESDQASFGEEFSALKRAEGEWAVFPLIRLRPEQVIGSIRQSASIQTADGDSHWLFRAIRLVQEGDFVREYGDLGENELQDRGGTIPQRLLMMNGERSGEATKVGQLNAAGRIAVQASTDEKCVETAYLVCLSRLPTPEELQHFVERMQNKHGDDRKQAVEDMIWTLYNATEFSWNH